ncbi:Beta-lactamase-like protein [Penicillium expansum]|uniref:Beta-lactamase-like protein n=1 Tax=Penicillium expansum TaxID=27334 RepID=A0A0A2JPD1_PENEN|nr:Beta-lactamase-like protein [Penicillium expansum]KGO56661.1 Beta-lactamase-like protein [Penicillium expansum]KGO72897.1 Beta-lactamase-like protein [Penicillium expansum]
MLEKIKAHIDDLTSGPTPKIPGVVCIAVNRKGDQIFSHASGPTKLNGSEPMTLDTVFWLASCTKLLTGIACMQLVEQGRLSLDDPDQLDTIVPELKDLKVLSKDESGNFKLVAQKNRITLRMLLTHTSGFGYAFDNDELCTWARPVGLDDFSGRREDVLYRPLTQQPGSGFTYGVGIDWVGEVVERVTNASLEDYFNRNILTPIGADEIRFFPGLKMKDRLAYMHFRDANGALSVQDHICRNSLQSNPNISGHRFCMGGCGAFGTPLHYTKVLATILNDGTCPKTNYQLLKPETIQDMFTDHIPKFPIHRNELSHAAKANLANSCPIIPEPGDPTDGWGLTFALSHEESPTGRSKGTASWEGIANLYWFADREKGIAMIIATQILPYGDFEVVRLYRKIEENIYASC